MRRFYVAGLAAFAGLSLGLCGCSLFPDEAEIDDTIHIEHYIPYQRELVKVKRGDVDESITIMAVYQYTTEKDYYLQYVGEPNQWGLEIHNYVTVGDQVKKGELLAEAPCEELEQQLSDYRFQVMELQKSMKYNKQLLKMADKDEAVSLKETIKDEEGQIHVLNMRIAETQERIADYRIYAEEDGQVTYLADAAMLGSFDSSKKYITVAAAGGVFRGTMDTTEDAPEIGDTFQATIEKKEIPVTVQDVQKTEENKTEVSFTAEQTYDDHTNATIHIRGKKRSNVLYIPENAVTQENGKSYVMIVREDGFARVKEITVSGPIDGKYVVESDLEEGEEIVSE